MNVRVVAATNRSLRDYVRDAVFAPTCTTACRSIRCRSAAARARRRRAVAGRAFLELNRARLGLRSLRLSADAQRACATTTGLATSASWSTWSGRAALKALSRGAESRNDIVTLEAALLDRTHCEVPLAPTAAAALAPTAPFMPFPPTWPMPRGKRWTLPACHRSCPGPPLRPGVSALHASWNRPQQLRSKLAKRLGMKATLLFLIA